MQRICVFCGSSVGSDPAYAAAARDLGRTLVARGLSLVYGGGHVGLMGVLADAVLAAGGQVAGVIPHALNAREIAHSRLTTLHVVDSMHERKARMAAMSDAFIALPGGFGTYEEFFEVVTWTQLGVHKKPCGILNVAGFYDPVIQLLDHAVREEFVRPQHRQAILVDSNPARLLDALAQVVLPDVPKWIGLAEA
ncbi:MAG TPA: TIGR00730 family Rossman fold protein [Patescibacteria group bacterium]|nr:TIGR00730 family Rossman fold protein [Patescibacteria group bacterium]